MIYNQREIVLVPFPYSDLTAIKKRPVLIISNNKFNKENDDVVVAAITSKTFSDEYSVAIIDQDLEFGILPEDSVIKTAKLFTVSKSRIVKKFSIINNITFQKVTSKIEKLIASENF